MVTSLREIVGTWMPLNQSIWYWHLLHCSLQVLTWLWPCVQCAFHTKNEYSGEQSACDQPSAEHRVLELCKQGCGLELENAWVSEKTNGTWLQLVRSCALSTVLWVPDFRSRSMQESSGFPRVVRREWVSDERGYWFLIHNIQTEVLDLMCELIY